MFSKVTFKKFDIYSAFYRKVHHGHINHSIFVMFFPMRNRNLNQLLILFFMFCIVDGCEGCHKTLCNGLIFCARYINYSVNTFFVAEFASKCKHWNTFFPIIELIALCWCQIFNSDLSVIYFFIIIFCWVTVCETSYFMLIITKHYFALQID